MGQYVVQCEYRDVWTDVGAFTSHAQATEHMDALAKGNTRTWRLIRRTEVEVARRGGKP